MVLIRIFASLIADGRALEEPQTVTLGSKPNEITLTAWHSNHIRFTRLVLNHSKIFFDFIISKWNLYLYLLGLYHILPQLVCL